MTTPKDIVCFDVSVPGKPHLLFLWMRNGLDMCRIADDGVVMLFNGATHEEALSVAAQLVGNPSARRASVEEAMKDLRS